MGSLRACREWAGHHTASSAAKSIGADYLTYLRWEKGRHIPSARTLIKLADAWGLTIDQILGRQPLPPPKPVHQAPGFAPPPGHPSYEAYMAEQHPKAM